ncbi:hypothetical protein RJ640_002859 [Escallonia rubra]|uniref:Uncharacterized protein n=1 Tax=Escallonia rubra TaxID=112253 RepID=A0AA88SA84_9ASTE|nr:hypothetical protein RJ640_002859 [Escallonia rubra]
MGHRHALGAPSVTSSQLQEASQLARVDNARQVGPAPLEEIRYFGVPAALLRLRLLLLGLPSGLVPPRLGRSRRYGGRLRPSWIPQLAEQVPLGEELVGQVPGQELVARSRLGWLRARRLRRGGSGEARLG